MEPIGTAAAHTEAWADVSNFNNQFIWAQAGWIKYRNQGSTQITQASYGELGYSATAPSIYVFGPAPAQDSTHTYECDLTDPVNGVWTFYSDSTVIGTASNNAWKNQTGTVVEYEGEIINLEDDMPGTPSDKCLFSVCQYKSAGGGYQDAGFVPSDVTSSDSTKWGATWISGNSFEIWDINP